MPAEKDNIRNKLNKNYMSRTSHPLPKQDFLSRLPEKHRHAISLTVLRLLPVLLFHATVLGDRQFLAHDTLHWRASAESIYEYRAEHGGEELWSTNMFGGMPAYIVDVGRAVPHLDSLVTVSASREAFDHILPQQNFDPRRMAVVETDGALDVTGHFVSDSESGVVSEVHVETYTARRITMSLTRSEPDFLVLSEIYYPPGWRAELNGEEIPIYKTNYLLRGMEIPAGEDTLQLSFNPKSHIWGPRISLVSNIIQWAAEIVLLGGLLRRKVK